MFGWKRERIMRELVAAIETTAPLETSNDRGAVQTAVIILRRASVAAADVSPEGARPGYELLQRLEARLAELDRIKTERAVSAIEDALRPCAHCTGRSYRISDSFSVEALGLLRVAICMNCTAVTMFLADRAHVTGKHPELTLGPEVTVGGDTPFR